MFGNTQLCGGCCDIEPHKGYVPPVQLRIPHRAPQANWGTPQNCELTSKMLSYHLNLVLTLLLLPLIPTVINIIAIHKTDNIETIHVTPICFFESALSSSSDFGM